MRPPLEPGQNRHGFRLIRRLPGGERRECWEAIAASAPADAGGRWPDGTLGRVELAIAADDDDAVARLRDEAVILRRIENAQSVLPCSRCGRINEAHYKFCLACGTLVGRPENLCALVDSGVAGGEAWIAYAWCGTSDLRTLMAAAGGRLAAEHAVPLLIDSLAALDRVHRSGIVHLNVKPASVRVDDRGTAVLHGFEIAVVRDGSIGRGDTMVAGTPAFMAPEQIAGAEIDHRTDLYAFGCLVHEVLAGRRAFDGETAFDLMLAHKSGEPRPLGMDAAWLPAGFEEVERRLLAKRREDRYPDAGSVMSALAAAARPLLFATLPMGDHERLRAAISAAEAVSPSLGAPAPIAPQARERVCPFCRAAISVAEASDAACEICGRSWANVTIVECGACGAHGALATYCPACGAEVQSVPTPQRWHDAAPPAPAPQEPDDRDDYWRSLQTAQVYGAVPAIPGASPGYEPPPGFGAPPPGFGAPPAGLGPPPPAPRVPGSVRAPLPIPQRNESTRAAVGGHAPRWVPMPVEEERDRSLDSVTFEASDPDRPRPPAVTGAPPFLLAGVATADPIPRLAAGTMLLDGYRIDEHIGTGGFADVYRATRIAYFDDEVAVKIPRSRQDVEHLMRTLRSRYKFWKVLTDKISAHIVGLRNIQPVVVGAIPTVAIFMEHMKGGSLLQLAERRWSGAPRTRADLGVCLRLFLEACRAVRTLHGEGLLHRDLKPSNFLLDGGDAHVKLADFELLAPIGEAKRTTQLQGTPPYLAPECFGGSHSVASEIFSLGASLHHLLTGRAPFGSEPPNERSAPRDPSEENPLVAPEVGLLVLRCLESRPEHRPHSVADLCDDLVRLGLDGAGVNSAPSDLARLLLTHLPDEDIAYMVSSLHEKGFRSTRSDERERHADLLEEYCYTAPPDEVLGQNCTNRQLDALVRAVGLAPEAGGRPENIAALLDAVGFLRGGREVPGIEPTRNFLSRQLLDVSHAATAEECLGVILSGLTAVERLVGLLTRFYAQLLHGSGAAAALSRLANGKPAERLTFGEQVGALRGLCRNAPAFRLPSRVARVFEWPLLDDALLATLGDLVKARNRSVAHSEQLPRLEEAQSLGRRTLSLALDAVTRLSESRYVPSTVQIVACQDDVYGRRSYLGRDDKGHLERIFTPLPLEVQRLYLFYALTNPVRINPLIFPFELDRR